MNVDRALKQLRFINMIMGLAVIVVEIFGIFSTIFDIFTNPGAVILNAFCVIFCFILCLYEAQFKKLSKKLRRLYGFLYTYLGRALYIFFIGTVVIATSESDSDRSIFFWIIGVIMIIVALYNVLIIFLHPAFKNGNRKITDDPTVSYSAGESELSNVLKKNPALATKMLMGASKLAT